MPKPKGRPRLVATGKSLVMQRRSRVEQTVLMPAYLQPQLREYVAWVASVESITEEEAMGSLMEVGIGELIKSDSSFQKFLEEREAERAAKPDKPGEEGRGKPDKPVEDARGRHEKPESPKEDGKGASGGTSSAASPAGGANKTGGVGGGGSAFPPSSPKANGVTSVPG